VSQVVQLELPDEVYATLKRQAEGLGVPLSEWMVIALERQSGLSSQPRTEAEKEAARQRFRRHAGAIDLGYPTGADNESIDLEELLNCAGRENVLVRRSDGTIFLIAAIADDNADEDFAREVELTRHNPELMEFLGTRSRRT
jgi:hypothetical protein